MERLIKINDNWEIIEDIHDIIRIIRTHYNCELANELDDEVVDLEYCYNEYIKRYNEFNEYDEYDEDEEDEEW